MAPQMKGLTQFIIDIRNSKDMEEEKKRINREIHNIQTKFNSSSSLNGYQRKKYVCKLIYIYLLGYTDEIDFGLQESFELLKSTHYSEKHLGYLAISVLVNNFKGDDVKSHFAKLLQLIHPYLIKDLQSSNDDINCLAIQFIASNFNILDVDHLSGENSSRSPALLPKKHLVQESDENSNLWLELIDMVYSTCCSPIQKPLVRKKAALALLVLLKLYPQVIISNDNWIPRLLTLIDDHDLGVKMLIIPLIEFLTSIKLQYVKSVIPSIANSLYLLVIENNCPQEYYYYDTPAPWLTVKLLLLIEHLFLLTDNHEPVLLITDIDVNTLNNLRQVVAKSIQNASQPTKGLPNRNSQSSVLFQAVSLAVFLEASPEAIDGAIHALILLLDSGETNTRYLSLGALIKLTARYNPSLSSVSSSNNFKDYLNKLFQLLNDRDISVRRKSLDLLYTICNSSTYNKIIGQLLDYFPLADLNIKSEIAVKVAILAEKFATDSTWYVTTMLRLLAMGGGSTSSSSGSSSYSPVNYIGNEVWERIVQIIVNNENLEKKSCKFIVQLLKRPPTHVSKSKQPVVMGASENLIKVAAFILGEYGHLVSEESESTPVEQFKLLYDAYFKVGLVTRAMLLSTFLKMIMRYPNEDFVPDILDLLEVENKSLDLEIQTRAYEYLKCATSILNDSNTELVSSILKPLPPFIQKESPLMNRLGSVQKLLGIGRSKSIVDAQNINRKGIIADHAEKAEEDANPFEEPTHVRVSPNWYAGYHRMLHYDAGIFYENQLVKITYRTIRNGPVINIKFTIINNAAKTAGTDITGFTVLDFKSMASKDDPAYVASVVELPELTISSKSTMEAEIKLRNVVENNESPILTLTFKCSGSFNQLNLKVPIVMIKTLTSTAMASLDDFKKRWLQIGQLLGLEGEFNARATTSHRFNSSNIVRLFTRLGFAVVHSTPDSLEDGILIMGAGILHTVKSNFGVLCTVKSTDSVGKEFEIVVRCTGGGVSEIIAQTMKEIFEGNAI